MSQFIHWFEHITKSDIPTVGGKGVNLGELTQANITVPEGFVVTTEAFNDFINISGLKDIIYQQLDALDVNDSTNLQSTSKHIKEQINHAFIPAEIGKAIEDSYEKLKQITRDSLLYVAVRSSATAEDLPDASFAGQQSTYLNIQGQDQLIAAVKACWPCRH